MLLQRERNRLLEAKFLKTDIARKLYEKYYFLLFEFARDLKNSYVSEITIKDDSVVLKTRSEGILLNCPEGDMTSALGQLILPGTEDEEEKMIIRLLQRILDEDDRTAVFFDVGANIGWYSILLAKLFSDLKIHSFEPVPLTFEQLKKNLDLNSVDSVQANNFGFSDRNGGVDFFVSPSLLAASSLANTYQTDDKMKISGEVRRLDDFCRENKIRPDLIKCDVEGAELLVFRGAPQILAEAKPVVVTELLRKWAKCFGYHPNDVIDLFKKHGYSCFVLSDEKLKLCHSITEETIETNFFFLHNEAHNYLMPSLKD